MVAYARPFITPEEYLGQEEGSETKHEYFNGQIFDMAGSTTTHNRITRNLNRRLDVALDEMPCDVFVTDHRVTVQETGLRTYPDVFVVCEEIAYDPLDSMAITNPCLIIEVLSPSTERYDRTEKFAHYQTIPSLTDYLLVAQNRMFVEHYQRKGEGGWHHQTYSLPEDRIHLESIGCTLRLADIYRRVAFLSLELSTTTDE